MFVNMFAIDLGNRIICIDTGFRKSNVLNGFRKSGLDFKKVSSVFLTHSDFDHIANVGIFSNATTYISEKEGNLIRRKHVRSFFNFYCESLDTYTALKDNSEIKINNSILVKAISTPGHTPGSMSYLLNDTILFTGDALILKNGKVKPFYPLLNMDNKTLTQSIKKLSNLSNISILITAHTGYTDKYEFAMKG